MADEFYNLWEKAAKRRRSLFLFLVIIPAVLASLQMSVVLPNRENLWLESLLVGSFGLLFVWISFGFWTTVAGLWVVWRGYDRFGIKLPPAKKPSPKNVRTAILMPIYNEDIRRVSIGLETTYRSVQRAGQLDAFDFFILSDTNDPDKWVREEQAWAELCSRVNGHRRIFYRNRRPNLKRKSGNIADFCRRWGSQYRYMIVLDADSIMSGESLARMVAAMEVHPDVGILQTVPLSVNRETLLGRTQQFANHVYGPLLAAGISFWQLGDAQYWGHNAILRVEPFRQNCGLPRLSGSPPFGGEILSHDFVEAALMRRAGWSVWLAYDLPGSFEETPPTIIDELERDRRWCQGNFQHLRLLFMKGLFSAHRAVFLRGALNYGSALLWLMFMSLSTTIAMWDSFAVPNYFPGTHTLFPSWPVWHWGWGVTLLISTAVVLFLPKVLCLISILFKQRSSHFYGGAFRLTISVLLETVLSTLLAPVRMLFHSKFVLLTLLGQKISWEAQSREDRGIPWHTALKLHGSGVLAAAGIGIGVFLVSRSFLLWLLPVLMSLVLAPATAVYTSRVSIGRKFRKAGLLLIPEEIEPTPELIELNALLSGQREFEGSLFGQLNGFALAVVDPNVHALHLQLLRRERNLNTRVAARREGLTRKALEQGPHAVTKSEKKELLSDPVRLGALHRAVWKLSDPKKAKEWGLA
ncbi:MAG: glucans biosynthesis glucosyltransferase MdoH [Desulfobacteraceae bacterium]|nr:MAG: glucans biosynthesis glucosyltransferase MdoH [Desulfobacteraceae bacterium]